MNPAPNPYATPVAPLPLQSQRSRVGILFGIAFALPFLLLAGAGLWEWMNDPNAPRISVVFVAAFAAVGGVTVLLGWWWAVRSRRGAGWLVLTSVTMGLGLATTLFALSVLGAGLWHGNVTPDVSGWNVYFAVATPIATAWMMLLGALVWWRVRVLERRLVD